MTTATYLRHVGFPYCLLLRPATSLESLQLATRERFVAIQTPILQLHSPLIAQFHGF